MVRNILGNFWTDERPTVEECIADMALEAPDIRADDHEMKVRLANGTVVDLDLQYRMQPGDLLILKPKPNTVNKERLCELLVRCFFAANEKELGQDVHFLLYPPEYPQWHYNIWIDGRWLHSQGSDLDEMLSYFTDHIEEEVSRYDWERRVSLAVQYSEEYPTPSRRHFLEAVCRYAELAEAFIAFNKEPVIRYGCPGHSVYAARRGILLDEMDEVVNTISDYTHLFCPDFELGEGLIVPVLRPVEVCYA